MNSLEEGETILLMLKSSRTEITVGRRLGPRGMSQSIPCRSPGGTHQAAALCWCVGACGWAGAGQAAASRRHFAVEMFPSHLGELFFSPQEVYLCWQKCVHHFQTDCSL